MGLCKQFINHFFFSLGPVLLVSPPTPQGGEGTPRPVLLTGAKKSGVPDYLRATVWAFIISLSVIKFTF